MNKPENIKGNHSGIPDDEFNKTFDLDELRLECFEKDNVSKGICSIMDYGFTLNECKTLHEWLDRVIKFHDNININS